MLICTHPNGITSCGTVNRDIAHFCRKCGGALRYHSKRLHNTGALIKRYRIIGAIGYGGYGAVYKAEDSKGDKGTVALKETIDVQSISGFESEFHVLQNHMHDNLPHYHEMFVFEGYGYLVMEYIPGQNLQHILQKQHGPVREKLVLFYADQLCDVLSYLHNQDPPIFHRDIKPANIRLTPEGLIKLVDFGLFKQGTQKTRSTIRGLGTPIYEPFEQFGRGNTDQRSDIYSLGATLYHLLTGKQPLSVPDRISETDDPLPSPKQVNPDISEPVSNAIVKAMNIFQHKRQPDIAAFRRELFGQISYPQDYEQEPSPFTEAERQLIKDHSLLEHIESIYTLDYITSHVNAMQSPPREVFTPKAYREWRREIEYLSEEFGKAKGYWCYVPPGEYLIGGWEKGDQRELISLPLFWIGRFLVTVAQFAAFLDAGGYGEQAQHWWTPNGWSWKKIKSRSRPGQWDNPTFNDAEQPVVGVSWYEAVAFAAWLSELLAEHMPKGYVIRLPTEAEWEVAQSYNHERQRCYYPWGEEYPSSERAIYEQGELGHTVRVGTCPAGAAACGAQDMSGNVWEWTSSNAHDYPQKAHLLRRDVTPAEWNVPVRGGSWWDYRTFMRCGTRDKYRPDFPAHIFGFRLVVAPK